MNTRNAIVRQVFVALAVLGPRTVVEAAPAVPSPVRIRISIHKERDTERVGLKRQSRRLDAAYRKRRLRGTDVTIEEVRARLAIQNLTPNVMRDLAAEVVFLADGRPDWRKSVYVEQARQTLRVEDLSGLARSEVESQAVQFATKRTFRGGGQSQGRESGREFAGVAVRLTREGQVIAEAFSPTSRARGFREALSWGPAGETGGRLSE